MKYANTQSKEDKLTLLQYLLRCCVAVAGVHSWSAFDCSGTLKIETPCLNLLLPRPYIPKVIRNVRNFFFCKVILNTRNFFFWKVILNTRNFFFWKVILNTRNFFFWKVILKTRNFFLWKIIRNARNFCPWNPPRLFKERLTLSSG